MSAFDGKTDIRKRGVSVNDPAGSCKLRGPLGIQAGCGRGQARLGPHVVEVVPDDGGAARPQGTIQHGITSNEWFWNGSKRCECRSTSPHIAPNGRGMDAASDRVAGRASVALPCRSAPHDDAVQVPAPRAYLSRNPSNGQVSVTKRPHMVGEQRAMAETVKFGALVFRGGPFACSNGGRLEAR
jgi:hypothetical protein